MLEHIAAFLVSLAVAAAGLAGLDTASTAPHGVGSPEIATARAALARQHAAEQVAAALERAELASEEEGDEVEEGDEGEGLVTAAGALTQALAHAPEAALPGLQNAFTRVTTAPTGSPEAADEAGQPDDASPVTTPSGPPAEVPAGPPDEVPGGPPADAPGGRP